MSRFKVLAVVQDEDIRFEIRKSLSADESIALVGFAAADEALLTKITGYAPHAVLLVKRKEEAGVLEYARLIYQKHPGCALILLTDEISLESVDSAMEAGIRKVVGLNDLSSLAGTIIKVSVLEQGRGGEKHKETRVISVYGTKGGSGKTNLAVNLAAAFSLSKHRTAFIDLCLIYGDASVYLDLSTKDTIAELVQERSDFTIDDIKSFTLQHASGLNAILAPSKPEFADYVTPRHVEKLINLMRPYYDYIVIDLPADFSECTLAALENSDDILIVAKPDISGLRNTKMALDVLNGLQQTEKIKLVINTERKGLLNHKDFERVLDMPVSFSIPEDTKNAVISMQRGIPIVMGMSSNPMAKAILGVSDYFYKLRGGAAK
ncbi:MAG: Septum site-determining protein MinD [Firmicutes bacterium ADurb.Bin182]|nr:MAG: Septum site-determining protein MinD [Firmicutes bacterium ADurb.Bin182]